MRSNRLGTGVAVVVSVWAALALFWALAVMSESALSVPAKLLQFAIAALSMTLATAALVAFSSNPRRTARGWKAATASVMCLVAYWGVLFLFASLGLAIGISR